MRRLNITIDDAICDKIDTFARNHGLTRSALLTTSALTYIEAQNQMPEVQAQLDELKKALEELTIK